MSRRTSADESKGHCATGRSGEPERVLAVTRAWVWMWMRT